MQQTPPLMRNESAVQRACSRDNPIKSLIMENIVRHGHESLEMGMRSGGISISISSVQHRCG